MWKHFLLRSAGFPVKQVLQLGSPEAVLAVDRLLELEDGLRRAVALADQRTEQAQRGLHGPAWKALTQLRKALKQGNFAKLAGWAGPAAAEVAAVWQVAQARDEQLR
ncbi:hypothetical protein, partial [Myxococcus vastator]|uniref:hypothetical protein n=1 Tax=Myxococcus vastator TaxID=2709664 RepID=UPI0013D5CBF3